MSITLQLNPELEARLLSRAAAQGMSVETYIEVLIEKQVVEGENRLSDEISGRAMVSLEENQGWESLLDRLGKSPSLMQALPLSDEAISRESIYQDRD